MIKLITAFGQTKSLAEWSAEKGWDKYVIQNRLRRGASAEEAISAPIPPSRGPRVKPEDFVGRRFGRLVVQSFAGVDRLHHTIWMCRCDCGNDKEAAHRHLISGSVKSCSCLQKETPPPITIKHGACRGSLGPSITYNSWDSMVQRCTNSNSDNYPDYGGRGVDVCESWMEFKRFLGDMGERPGKEYSIERVDNSKGYTPGNCVWATRAQQARNTRRNRRYVVDGESLCLVDIAKKYAVNYCTLRGRLNSGYSVEAAIGKVTKIRRKA